MIQAPTFTKSGAKKDAATKLDQSIFEVTPNAELVAQAYNTHLAAGRLASATTLRRGEVAGGGRKPWRQKGTGRARVGSTRVPQWRHGGVVFGPLGIENYTKGLPIKAKRAALRQALSIKAETIRIVEGFSAPDGKVKPMVELLFKIKAEGTILLAVEHKTDLIDRATRNISGVKAVQAKYLNVFDIMNADTIILTDEALATVGQWLGKDVVAAPAKAAVKDEAPAAAPAKAAAKPAAKKPAAAEGAAK